jgi:hypothetical protein
MRTDGLYVAGFRVIPQRDDSTHGVAWDASHFNVPTSAMWMTRGESLELLECYGFDGMAS